MDTPRKLALALAATRIGYAAALFVAPARVTAGWLGADAEPAGARVAVRGLGFRDGAISAGVAVSALTDRPLRPWLLACAASDLADVAATLIDRKGLPDKAAPATIALAGGTAAAGLAIAAHSES